MHVSLPTGFSYCIAMPDDLYHRDALTWSEHQASLLRRVARGERLNEVDWEHVIEEIEDVGLSELHAVESYLELIFVHLLKIRIWPDGDVVNHWRAELVSFQSNACGDLPHPCGSALTVRARIGALSGK